MTMETRDIVLGAEFFHISPDEFGVINKRANTMGMRARIFEMEGDGEDKLISFVLVASPSRAPLTQ